MSNNLSRFQWQIGDTVFGPGTQYEILGTNVASYTVNNQDSQIPNSDEITMAKDTFQAGIITFTIGVRDNAPMRYIANSLPAGMVDKAEALLDVLQDEWKANAIKQQWGQYEPLIHRDGYGLVKQIYGRPRKFQYSPKTKTSQFRKVTAEFARMDTLCYADIESVVFLEEGASPVFYSVGGRADSWFRVLLFGPMSNPIITVGPQQIQLNMSIDTGVEVEVSSYPWSRRIIDSNGINWRTKLVGSTKYLDQLILPKGAALAMSWSATGTTDASTCAVLWRDAYNVI